MTSFGSLFKVLGMQRFRKMNYVAGLSLAAIFVSLLWSWFTTGISSGQVFSVTESWLGLASMVVWILLAIDNEHVYTRDTFRLIPVSDMKLYLTNLLASLSAFVYFGLIHLVLMGISARIDHKFLMDLTHGVGNVPIHKALIVTGC
ncbi:ABC transporter, permease protein [Levilactobacillus brevis]|nr:ABC transporter, permease protein [Levilactobacillus brevis]